MKKHCSFVCFVALVVCFGLTCQLDATAMQRRRATRKKTTKRPPAKSLVTRKKTTKRPPAKPLVTRNLLDQLQTENRNSFNALRDAERAGIERAGARLICAVNDSRTPWITFVVRRLYGVAGACHHRGSGMYARYCWPSSRWGSMHVQGGAAAAYKTEIAAAPDPTAKLVEIEQRLDALSSPFRTAEVTGQDIIELAEAVAVGPGESVGLGAVPQS